MSIELENPKTVLEKVDAAANLIEQMALAHAIKDQTHFNEAKEKAAKFLFQVTQELSQ